MTVCPLFWETYCTVHILFFWSPVCVAIKKGAIFSLSLSLSPKPPLNPLPPLFPSHLFPNILPHSLTYKERNRTYWYRQIKKKKKSCQQRLIKIICAQLNALLCTCSTYVLHSELDATVNIRETVWQRACSDSNLIDKYRSTVKRKFPYWMLPLLRPSIAYSNLISRRLGPPTVLSASYHTYNLVGLVHYTTGILYAFLRLYVLIVLVWDVRALYTVWDQYRIKLLPFIAILSLHGTVKNVQYCSKDNPSQLTLKYYETNWC